MNGDDLIGQTQIKMSALVVNSNQKDGVTDWYSLFYNNERVGLILIQSTMLPLEDGSYMNIREDREMTIEQ